MKKISLFVIFLFILGVPKSFAFFGKVSGEQYSECRNRAAGQLNQFSAKQIFQDCIKAYKEANKQISREEKVRIKKSKKLEKLKEKYSKICFNNLFESYKESLEWTIYVNSFGDVNEIYSFIDQLNINKKSNTYFDLSNNQRNLLDNNVRTEKNEITKFAISKRIFKSIENNREEFLKELDQCAIDKSKTKSFLKFF
tara:strand:+ start:64 stop:654 length:591 start_codon:yes stop_codon:yes gene_type:complete